MSLSPVHSSNKRPAPKEAEPAAKKARMGVLYKVLCVDKQYLFYLPSVGLAVGHAKEMEDLVEIYKNDQEKKPIKLREHVSATFAALFYGWVAMDTLEEGPIVQPKDADVYLMLDDWDHIDEEEAIAETQLYKDLHSRMERAAGTLPTEDEDSSSSEGEGEA